jgi:hypothetical protein
VGNRYTGDPYGATTVSTPYGPVQIAVVEDLLVKRLAAAKHRQVPAALDEADLLWRDSADQMDDASLVRQAAHYKVVGLLAAFRARERSTGPRRPRPWPGPRRELRRTGDFHYGAFGAVLAPHAEQNFDPAGIAAEHAAHFIVPPAVPHSPRFGSRRTRVIAMIQTPTISRIHVTNPTSPKISRSDRTPEKPENRLERGLLELLPFPLLLPFPFPEVDWVTSTLTLLLGDDWLPWESVAVV